MPKTKSVPPTDDRISFRLSPSGIESLENYCTRTKVTRSEALRSLVEQAVSAPGSTPAKRQAVNVSHEKLSEHDDPPPRSLFVRLTDGEGQGVRAAAADFRSPSAWAALVIRAQLDESMPVLGGSETDALAESNAQLRRLGINLNQIAHRLHQDDGFTLSESDRESIRESMALIKAHTQSVQRLIRLNTQRVKRV